MKKFSFPLERVLGWRNTQVQLAEAELDRTRSELRALDQRRADLARCVDDASAELLRAPSTTAAELAALQHFRSATAAQSTRLLHTRSTIELRIQQQTQAVVESRRKTRLLERLKETRLASWRAAAQREVDQMAEESHLARLARGEFRSS